jgi:hypothetical protein
VALLWFFTGLTFGSVQIGAAVMLQDGADRRGGGRRQRVAPAQVPAPIPVRARR